MKCAKLLHNPGAGDEGHGEEELVGRIEAAGFKCHYQSVKKKGWNEIEPEVDFLIIAGGDGTVRKVTKELVQRSLLDKSWPIALLPLGTANNIARTLELEDDTETLIRSWHGARTMPYDVGRVVAGDTLHFFLESFGYGLFPYLMMEMGKREAPKEETAEESIQAALETLHRLVLSYEARYCRLVIDGVDYSGTYLLAEVMNTRSIGPNLFLAPDARPDDGELEVVVVPEVDRQALADYIGQRRNGHSEAGFRYTTIKGKEVHISWAGTHVHVDDEVLKLEKEAPVQIELKNGLLKFLVP